MSRIILLVAEWRLEVHTRTQAKWICIQQGVIVAQEMLDIAVCFVRSLPR